MLKVIKPRRGTVFPDVPVAPPGGRPPRICMIEPGTDENQGSMGCVYIMNAARDAGYPIDYVHPDDAVGDYDIELISLHHCTDYLRLRDLRRRAPIRIIGGHPTVNNIRPAIPFADAICIGEGEQWIVHALRRLHRIPEVEILADLPGTILARDWERGAPIPPGNTIEPLPRHPPYLNRAAAGHARVWYLEMARGCPFTCHYCELGWAWKYRAQDTDWLLEQIDSIDTARSNRISLFAPDEASHPGYHAILDRINHRNMITSFGSMRLDVIVKKDLPFRPNMLIRVGLDGLTEETRHRVGKRISDQDVWEYFRYMSDRGHATFKVFMVIGYPWEQPADFDAWEALWDRISRIPRRANARVRVKFTPLIPQPATPLGDAEPRYDPETIGRILAWFERVGRPYRRPGWFVVNDGIMSARSHSLQCKLTLGDEATLLDRAVDFRGTETLRGYDVWDS